MKSKYKILPLQDIAKQLNIKSNKKLTEVLIDVIEGIENTGYKFIQFIQIVDTIFVILDTNNSKTAVPDNEKEVTTEIIDNNIKNEGKPLEMKSVHLPWKK